MNPRQHWKIRAVLRRSVLAGLVAVPALLGAEFMASALPQPGSWILNSAVTVILVY